ncbi:MAG: hypothetical protein RBR71_14350 [Gudongella sp.]|nr:hypothetical protein [Gudongella sp.]
MKDSNKSKNIDIFSLAFGLFFWVLSWVSIEAWRVFLTKSKDYSSLIMAYLISFISYLVIVFIWILFTKLKTKLNK